MSLESAPEKAVWRELLDFPKFADPSVLNMRAGATALQLSERLSGAGSCPMGPFGRASES
jgi:hypothetical protein